MSDKSADGIDRGVLIFIALTIAAWIGLFVGGAYQNGVIP